LAAAWLASRIRLLLKERHGLGGVFATKLGTLKGGQPESVMRYPEADLRAHISRADPYTRRRILESYSQIDEVLAIASPDRHEAALDVGCGAGYETFALAGEFDRVIAIDVSRRALRTARGLARRFRLERIHFRRRNALAPARSGPFDFVYCNVMSHGTRSRCELVRRLVLATKPGGSLFISEECEGYAPLEAERAILERDERLLRERLRQVINALLGLTSFRFFASGTLGPILANYGAAVTHTETHDWERLPYLERTWARRVKAVQSAPVAHPDYHVLPTSLRDVGDLCRPLLGRRLSAHERLLVRQSARSDAQLAPLAMFLLMVEAVDPRLSAEHLPLTTRLRSRLPATLRRAEPDWPLLDELFAEFRTLVSR
jgi:2-polyprenyl-3-methyl-5-hydroxy-6-metoxy-1,4-benzoquinol methylase